MRVFEGLHAFMWSSPTVNNCNTYLIDDGARILIDPGHDRLFGHVEDGLRAIGISDVDIDLIIATHAHPDHYEAAKRFINTPATFAINSEEAALMKDMGRILGSTVDPEECRAQVYLQEGELNVKGVELKVIPTPGHSPGSISLYWPEKKALFPGDLIFVDGLGRTDLPGGDGKVLKESISKLAGLEIEWLLPGHGALLTGAENVKRNFQRVEQFWFRYI